MLFYFSDMQQYLEGVGVVYRDEGSEGYSIEKDMNLTKFLNRLLGLPVLAQNSLFQYFSDTLREVVDQAKRDCRYDLGIMGKQQKFYSNFQAYIDVF